MTDVAWARLERGLWARLDLPAWGRAPTRRSRAFAVGGFVGATTAAVAGIAFAAKTTAPEQSVAPPPSPEIAGAPILDRTRVVTQAAPTSVTFGGVAADLAAQTAFEYASSTANARVDGGVITFTVAPRDSRPRLSVLAADVTIEANEGRFRVSRDGEHVELQVERGFVRLRFRDVSIALLDGDAWDSSRPSTRTRTP